MMKTAVKRVRDYLLARKWDNYLVILPTAFLVNEFVEELLVSGTPQGALRPRIYTFESFVDMVLATSSSSTMWIGEVEKTEILRNIINNSQLKREYYYFSNVEKHPGIVQAVTQTIGELKRAVIFPERLGATLDSRDINSSKMHDLRLIYESYQQFLTANNLGDRDDRYLEVLNLLAENRVAYLNDVEFAYIDWFEDYTGVQAEVFRVIKQCVPEVLIGAEATSLVTTKLTETHLLKGWGREGEVRQVAGLIKRMIREEGLSLDDIVLVCRDPAVYSSHLRRIFTEAGIPLCLDWKETLGENRMVESLLMFLEAAGAETGVTLWELLDNTYLTGNDNHASQCLTDWSRGSINIELQPSEWLDRLEKERPDGENYQPGAGWDSCYKWLQGFIDVIDNICKQGMIIDIINSVRVAMGKLKIERNILELSEDITFEEKIRLVRRDLRAWQAFSGILNEMEAAARILGNDETTLNSFWQQLRSYADSESYSPDTVCRGGVQILAPTQIRGLKFNTVVVMGMQEGEFPRSINSDWVINDRERVELRPEIDLPTSWELYQREKVLFKMVREACRGQLWLTYPAIDEDGQAVLASLYIEEMGRYLGQPLEADEPQPVVFPDDWQDGCSLREVALSLLHQGHRNIGYRLVDEKLGVDKHLQALEEVDARRRGREFSPWDGCFSTPGIISQLSTKQMNRVFNVSYLNTYANCPMKYFLAVELGLKPLPGEETAINYLDKGMLQHQVLQRVFAGKVPDDDAGIMTLVGDILDKVCIENNCLGQQYPHPLLWEYEKRIIRDNLTNLVIAEVQRLSEGNYSPAYQEWGFG
ncbi:MAG: PD-(D/E)XK nuclease family protein, partial [Syntrophomonas sp.]